MIWLISAKSGRASSSGKSSGLGMCWIGMICAKQCGVSYDVVATLSARLTSRCAPPGTSGGFLLSPVLIICPFDNATYVSFCTAAMNRVLPSQNRLTSASNHLSTSSSVQLAAPTHSQLVLAKQNQHSSIVNILISFFGPAPPAGSSGQSWIQWPDWLHR